MPKGYDEVAGEILQEVIKAKASIIVVTGNSDSKTRLINEHLSDEAIAESFKKIYAAVANPVK